MKYLSFLLIGFLFAFPKQSNSQLSVDKDSIISEIERRISLPEIPDYSVSITKFGAKGDSLTDCKRAFDKALKHLNKKNGGTLVVPSGTYMVNGPIHLISNLNLHLEKGAKIRFGDNPEDYLPMVQTSWEGTILYNYSPLVYADGQKQYFYYWGRRY